MNADENEDLKQSLELLRQLRNNADDADWDYRWSSGDHEVKRLFAEIDALLLKHGIKN